MTLHIPPSVVSHQHAPVALANGNILTFDNGNFRTGAHVPFSRVLEIDPATNAVVWSYADEMVNAFFTAFMGNAQRLPNGNTHITESATGRLFEVTPAGEVVWEYIIPWFAQYPDAAARANRAGTSQQRLPDLSLQRASSCHGSRHNLACVAGAGSRRPSRQPHPLRPIAIDMKNPIHRRAALALSLALGASLGGPTADAQEARPVRILTNWFIQPDQAGYWQAAQDNLGKEAGLKISVTQGGPRIQTIPQVASGQAEFGIGNADDVLLARLRGAPVRAVFAPLDHVPYTLRLPRRPVGQGHRRPAGPHLRGQHRQRLLGMDQEAVQAARHPRDPGLGRPGPVSQRPEDGAAGLLAVPAGAHGGRRDRGAADHARLARLSTLQRALHDRRDDPEGAGAGEGHGRRGAEGLEQLHPQPVAASSR